MDHSVQVAKNKERVADSKYARCKFSLDKSDKCVITAASLVQTFISIRVSIPVRCDGEHAEITASQVSL